MFPGSRNEELGSPSGFKFKNVQQDSRENNVLKEQKEEGRAPPSLDDLPFSHGLMGAAAAWNVGE